MRKFIKVLIPVLVLAGVTFTILHYVVGSYTVTSFSMDPGITMGEHLLINKMAYHYSEPDRGDIVYYKSPVDNLTRLTRIIGLPGDIIAIKSGSVYVNGVKFVEPYVRSAADYNLPAFQLIPGYYFVLGDNRADSDNSPTARTVPRQDILGKAWIFTWPPGKWGEVDNYPLDPQLAAAEAP